MNEKSRKKFTEEVNDIVKSRTEFINKHYLSVRDTYKNHYDWPELDPLRHEISLCITFGLCQAAITLTNHLLESVLKYGLITNHGMKSGTKEGEKGGVLSLFLKKFEKPIKLFDDKDLGTTINQACTSGLITKKQKKKLHEYRTRFRNAYGHSNKSKTFGDSTVPMTGADFSGNNITKEESGNVKIADFLPVHGLAQAMTAQEEAPPYFLYIDKLVREIWCKLLKENE